MNLYYLPIILILLILIPSSSFAQELPFDTSMLDTTTELMEKSGDVQDKTQQVLESSPTGSTVAWNNPDTDVDYSVTPTRTYESDSGPCRDYTTEAVIEGRAEIVHGTACRSDDGSWHATN